MQDPRITVEEANVDLRSSYVPFQRQRYATLLKASCKQTKESLVDALELTACPQQATSKNGTIAPSCANDVPSGDLRVEWE